MSGQPLSESSHVLEHRVALRLREELEGTSLLPAADVYEQVRTAALHDGSLLVAQLARTLRGWRDYPAPWPGLRALGLDPSALPLTAGLGLAQARGLGAALARGGSRERAVEAAAVLNLLIGLFDFVCDRRAGAADEFRSVLGGDALSRLLSGISELEPTGSPAVDAVLAVGQHYVNQVRGLTLSDAARAELRAALDRMLTGELASLDHRGEGPPGGDTWVALHDKSALPLWAMAVTAAPDAIRSEADLATMRSDVVHIGELLWIVDDLLDARADWDAGVWSRPWILLARCCPQPPDDADQALAALFEHGVVDEEARRAAARARALGKFARQRESVALQRALGASVESWLRGAEALPSTAPE